MSVYELIVPNLLCGKILILQIKIHLRLADNMSANILLLDNQVMWETQS